MRRTRGGAIASLVGVLALTACGAISGPAPCPEVGASPASDPPHHDDPELESRIPKTVNGEPFEVFSMCATTSDPGGLPTAPEFLEAIGVRVTDVTVARDAGPRIGGTDEYTGITAVRFRGAPEDVLRETYTAMYVEGMDDTGIDTEAVETTLGGKTVHQDNHGAIWYVADDTVYHVFGEHCEEVLHALP